MDITYALYVIEDFLNVIHPNYNEEKEQDNEDNIWNIIEDFFQQIGPHI
jgi:hypothetical protein